MGLYIVEPTPTGGRGRVAVVEEAVRVEGVADEETAEVGIMGLAPVAGVLVGVVLGGMGIGGWPMGVS
jgi:hypothetical protein